MNNWVFPYRSVLIIMIMLFLASSTYAQEKYWVSLKDKAGVNFDPYSYFSTKTIEKRLKHGIPLNHSTDRPLNEAYVKTIESIVNLKGKQSRWLNGLVVYAEQQEIEEVRGLPFVKSVQQMDTGKPEICSYSPQQSVELSDYEIELARGQLERMSGDLFIQKSFDGKGVRIAVFDIGFKNVDTNPAFAHLREKNSIIKTWDFVDNDSNVYHYHHHGTQVLSCIGGKIDSIYLGLATGAEFLLARTEKNSEKFKEEENWLAAAEWADKNGVDIINSSLGYTHHRYFSDQMDGSTSLVARAATMAAKKGILVVNSAGNSGSDDWYYVGTPADADSVLSVGGISPDNNFHISFSSFGPTADGRMKPNVSAYGTALTARGERVAVADGTSFSSPLIAGFAACAWHTNLSLTNMELFEQIQRSADLYPYFDYAHGYGVPQASWFLSDKKGSSTGTFSFNEDSGTLNIVPKPNIDFETSYDENFLFYNFQREDGVLTKYAVIRNEDNGTFSFDLNRIDPGTKINVWYRGAFKSYIINE